MKKYILIGVLSLGLVACTAKKAVVVEEVIDMSNFTPELVQGKTIYDAKCGKCHDLPKPSDYSKEKWVPIMNHMAKKAKISDEDRELVYNYVTMNL